MGKQWKQWQTVIFLGPVARKSSWKKSYDKPRQCIIKQRHHFANKGPSSQRYNFSSHHVWVWELDCKESWVLKNWCFWSMVLEKTFECPLDCKEINPVNPKGNQSWIFFGKTDAWSWNSNTLATWCEGLTHQKRPWCLERLKAGEGDDRGWDGWITSPTRWPWVWASSRSWWWTGKPGILQSMGLHSRTRLSDLTDWHYQPKQSWNLVAKEKAANTANHTFQGRRC